MKKFLAVFVLCFALVTASVDADAARRIGGGSSFGRSVPTFKQKSSTPKTAPSQIPYQKSATNKTSQQARQSTAPQTPPRAARPSMMRSVLTGLATALGISALLSMLGIHSAGFASLLTGLFVVMALYFLFRTMLGQRKRNPHSDGTATMSRPDASYREERPSEYYQSQSDDGYRGTAARQGSVMDQFSTKENISSSIPESEENYVEDITPDDFDRKSFLSVALENYRKLQKAWDTGNVIEISEFTTQDIFTAITHQLRLRGHEVYNSDIRELSNELLGISQEGNVYLAAVRFKGLIVIAGEEESIDEVWVLEKPVIGSGGWLLAGIKQTQE